MPTCQKTGIGGRIKRRGVREIENVNERAEIKESIYWPKFVPVSLEDLYRR